MRRLSAESLDHRPQTGVMRWFLLTGNRLLIALVILIGIWAAFLVVGLLGIATVTKATRVMWYLNGTVNGLLTLVPITVGVNQIVLSHEFGSIEDIYDRRTNITDFRERVEEHTGTPVSSPYAHVFFGTLLSSIAQTGHVLQERADRLQTDEELTDEIDDLAGSIVEAAEHANDELSATGSSMLGTLLVVLFYDDTDQFHQVRRLQTALADAGAETEELDRITELFYELDAARQFLKTLVVERQLARLSRLLIYTGVPAVTVAALGIFTYRDVAGLTVSHPLLVVVAGTILVATLVPLAILGAYILRVATIAHQTAAYGPFIPHSSD